MSQQDGGSRRRSRREFVGTIAVGAVGVAATSIEAGRASAQTSVPEFPFAEATIADLQKAMESGAVTSKRLVEMYLGRIEALDRSGPMLRAVIEVNPDAVAIADAMDAERATKGPRGPLHGIPVLVKDNLDSADHMATTSGSLALVGSKPSRDSHVVKRLRDAGAVLLGKTNQSEWANFRSTRSTSGWSGRGGQCRNPYALDRNPSGSSSGSGVAVSASLCAVAVGTETDGSVVAPASACGIVGIKPTVGLVSRAGIIPIAHSQDTAGPMARTVADAAALLDAMIGEDPRDPVTRGVRATWRGGLAAAMDPNGLKGARIGIVRNLVGSNPGVRKLMDEAADAMTKAGAVPIDVTMPSVLEISGPEFEVLLYEFKADLNAYLAELGPGTPVKSLAAVIDFNEKNRDREMPWFGQEILEMAQSKGPLTDPAYRKALASCRRLSRTLGIDRAVTQFKLDALAAPTADPAWLTDPITGDHAIGGSTTPAAVAGYPSITLPMGSVAGLPVGLSFFGKAYSEPALVKYAYAFEQLARHRTAPRFLASVTPA